MKKTLKKNLINFGYIVDHPEERLYISGMKTLDEIKSALNWHNITMIAGHIVIRVDESDLGLIQGLKSNEQCIYLDHPEFQSTIISFFITVSPQVHHQYWVLGDKLHRLGGPAMISVTETSLGVYSTRSSYYLNGMKHRTDGPAEVLIKGQRTSNIHPRTLIEVDDTWVIEEWESLEAYWFNMGIMGNFPLPYSAEFTSGIRIFRKTSDGLLSNDFDDMPAFETQQAVVNWFDDTETSVFWPTIVKVSGYTRHYNNGDFDKHECERIIYTKWMNHDDHIEITDDDNLRNELFPQWNLWDGPFFPDNQELTFTLQEVIKLYNEQQ